MPKFRIGWQCKCSPRVHAAIAEAESARDATQLFFEVATNLCETAQVLTCEIVPGDQAVCTCSHPTVAWGNVTKCWFCMDCGFDLPALDLEGCTVCGEDFSVGQRFRAWRGSSGVFAVHDACFLSLHSKAFVRGKRWPLMAHSKVHYFPARGFTTTGAN